jgi:hypothetical protein
VSNRIQRRIREDGTAAWSMGIVSLQECKFSETGKRNCDKEQTKAEARLVLVKGFLHSFSVSERPP